MAAYIWNHCFLFFCTFPCLIVVLVHFEVNPCYKANLGLVLVLQQFLLFLGLGTPNSAFVPSKNGPRRLRFEGKCPIFA